MTYRSKLAICLLVIYGGAVSSSAVAQGAESNLRGTTDVTTTGSKAIDGTVKVKPGETGGNSDVTVVNDSDKASAKLVLKDNDTQVSTDKDFEGKISGLDGGDTVDLGTGQRVLIEGEGGDISIGKHSVVTLVNSPTDPSSTSRMEAVAKVGGNEITIVVKPGSTVVVTTTGNNITIETS